MITAVERFRPTARRPAARHHRQRTATTAIVRASKHPRKRASTHSSKQAAKSDPPAASIERVHEHTHLQVSDRADHMEHVSDLINGLHSTSFAGSPSGPLPPSPKPLASAIRRPSRWPRGSLPQWSGQRLVPPAGHRAEEGSLLSPPRTGDVVPNYIITSGSITSNRA